MGDREVKEALDFGNDAAHTIVLIEVTDSGIAWAEPKDFSLDTLGAAQATLPAILSSFHCRRGDFFFTYDYDSGVNVVLADGSVHFLWLGKR